MLDNEAYGLEEIGKGYEYILRGKLSGDRLDLGAFSIQDDYLNQFPMFDGKYIEFGVQGLWVTFLPTENESNDF